MISSFTLTNLSTNNEVLIYKLITIMGKTFFGSEVVSQIDDEENEDYYSPTDWDREPNESDEDYAERVQDLEDYLESFD